MKKTYQSPRCQAILLADDDVLTTSTYTLATPDEGTGNFGDEGSAVIEWC